LSEDVLEPLQKNLYKEEEPDNERGTQHLPGVRLYSDCSVTVMVAAVIV